MDRMKNRIFILLVLSLGACTSTNLTFSSNPPGAEVITKPIGSGAEKVVGITPLNISTSEISDSTSGTGPLKVLVRKQGYKDKELLIPEMGADDMLIQVDLAPLPALEDTILLNKNLERIFQSQSYVQSKKFDDAIKLLEQVRNQVPQISATYEMLGGIYYLRGDRLKAIDNLQRAKALYPDSLEALSLLSRIKRADAIKPETPTGDQQP